MKDLKDVRIRVTPTGILAAAFTALVKEAEDPKAWWRTSPLLAGTGLAYHLDQMGYEVVPKAASEPSTDPA